MIRSVLRAAARSSFTSSTLRRFNGELGTILCLHRVLPSGELSRLPSNRALELTPEHLDEILGWARSHGYHLASLDEVVEALREKDRSRRLLCITFDDGYRDNLIHALPVLERHQAPAAIFVITDAIDGTLVPWWYALGEVLGDDPAQQERFSAAREVIFGKAGEDLHQHLGELGIDPALTKRLNTSLWLSWDEVRECSRHPLITIGSHTVSHAALARLTAAEALSEMVRSKARLEAEIGQEVAYLAFPFGGPSQCGPRDFELAKQAGYTAALTTLGGNLEPGDAGALHSLPRRSAGEYDFDLRLLVSQWSGFDRLRGGGRKRARSAA